MNKDLLNILAEYTSHGFRVERGGRHHKIFDGQRLVTVLSGSKCGGRAERNAHAALRRALRQRQVQAA
jgi:hypothetical protein